jgi:hypothetical protein
VTRVKGWEGARAFSLIAAARACGAGRYMRSRHLALRVRGDDKHTHATGAEQLLKPHAAPIA